MERFRVTAFIPFTLGNSYPGWPNWATHRLGGSVAFPYLWFDAPSCGVQTPPNNGRAIKAIHFPQGIKQIVSV